MRSDKERLIDIDTFLKKIISEYNQLKFDSDETFRYGLLKYLEIIGEASRTLRKDIIENDLEPIILEIKKLITENE